MGGKGRKEKRESFDVQYMYKNGLECIYVQFSHEHIINPLRACARATVVGSVCLSVKSHLTSGASAHPESDVTYSAGNEEFVGFSLKPLCYSDPASLVVRPYIQSAIFKAHALTNEACQFAVRTQVLHQQAPNQQLTGKRNPTRAHATAPRVCTLVPFIMHVMQYVCQQPHLAVYPVASNW